MDEHILYCRIKVEGRELLECLEIENPSIRRSEFKKQLVVSNRITFEERGLRQDPTSLQLFRVTITDKEGKLASASVDTLKRLFQHISFTFPKNTKQWTEYKSVKRMQVRFEYKMIEDDDDFFSEGDAILDIPKVSLPEFVVVVVKEKPKDEPTSSPQVCTAFQGRNMDINQLYDAFDKLNLAPSSFYTKTEKYIGQKVYCNRPTFYEYSIPVVLLCETFAAFVSIFHTEIPSKRICEFAIEFCSAMAKSYDSEEYRKARINAILNDLLENFKANMIISETKLRLGTSDGSIKLANEVLVLNIEYKNESGFGNGAAELQNVGYLVNHLKKSRIRYQIASLLVKIVGAEIRIDGAVVTTEGLFIDPLTPSIPALPFFNDRNAMKRVACMLNAFYKTIVELRDIQEGRQMTPGLADPWLKEINIDGKYFKIQYIERMEKKLMWKCFLLGDEQSLNTDKRFYCIKFVQRYGSNVHRYCSDKGFAPKYITEVELKNTGWKAIVMDWIGLDNYNMDQYTCSSLDTLKEYIKNMHVNGFVHGDLRRNNIMKVNIDENNHKYIVVDFDWSGNVKDNIKYPCFMNHTEILWPPGAEDGELILQKHDVYWLDQL